MGHDPFPDVPLPAGDAWRWTEERRSGDVVDEIVAAARDADLLVMPTDGRDGFLDVFRGSHPLGVAERIGTADPVHPPVRYEGHRG